MTDIINKLHKLLLKNEILIIGLENCSLPFFFFSVVVKDTTVCLFTAEIGKEVVSFNHFVENNLFEKIAVINGLRDKK